MADNIDELETKLSSVLTQEEREKLIQFLQKNRIAVSLPPLRYCQFLCWCWLKDQDRASMAANTISARVEANMGGIEADLEEMADLMGVTVAEVKAGAIAKQLLTGSKSDVFDSDKWKEQSNGLWMRI